MAFGKDPKLALTGGSFRQSTNMHTKNRVQRGTKGRIPYFVDAFMPSLLIADTIRLIPGQYIQEQAVGEGDNLVVQQATMPYIKFTEHYLAASKKSCICSAGPFQNIKSKREPCRGCDIFWETAKRNPSTNRLESNVISRQNKYSFSVLDYADYHKIEQYDRETHQVKVNQKTGEPFFNWVKCQGQGCDACKAMKELKHGHMAHWPMSYSHFQTLRQSELGIGQACVRCGTVEVNRQPAVKSIAWACPACGSPAIDMTTTEFKLDEILKITDNPYKCNDCQEEIFLTEEIACLACAPRGQQGARAGLFDVDLRVQLFDTGQLAKVLQVSGWTPPRPVDPNFAVLVQPVDLVARYAPDTWEYQIARFGLPNPASGREPVTGTPPQQSFSHYGPKSS